MPLISGLGLGWVMGQIVPAAAGRLTGGFFNGLLIRPSADTQSYGVNLSYTLT